MASRLTVHDERDTCSRLHRYQFIEDRSFQRGWEDVKKNLQDCSPQMFAQKFLEAKVFYFSRYVEPVTLDEYIQWLSRQGSPKDEPRSTKRETENLTYDFNEIIPEPESYLTKDINPLSGDHEASSGNVHQEKFSSESIRESEDMIHPKDTCVLEELPRKDICETRKCKDNSNPNEGDSEQWTESVENTKKQTIEASQCNINSDSGEDMVHDPLSFFDLLRLVERGEPVPGVAELCVEPTNDEPTPPTASRIRKPWES